MKIAVIEDDKTYLQLLKTILKEGSWEIEYFSSPSEFGKVDLKKFDVLVIDHVLPVINGRDLINSISNKTNAEIFLMSGYNNFSKEDIHDIRIKGLIDKTKPKTIIDQLRYVDAKIRINKCIEVEKEKFQDIIYNGYNLQLKEDLFFLELKHPLSSESRKTILSKIKEQNIKKLIVSFATDIIVHSALLGELTFFYKILADEKGKIVFYNSSDQEIVREQLSFCNLDKIIPVFNDKESAISYLQSSNIPQNK